MKKLLLIVLCLVSVSVYAQKAKKKATTTKKPVKQVSRANTRATAPLDTAKKPVATVAKPVAKPAAAPAKPFDRPVDGYYQKTDIMNARVTPYAALREADVAMSKRVWREIDLREKMNSYMGSPKARLIDILMKAIADGELTAYDATANPAKDDPNGDSFSTPLTPEQVIGKMADSTTVDKFDKNGDKTGSTLVAGTFAPDSIVKFRIKEDWIFDKQRSVYEPRIIGIAPMIKQKVAGVTLNVDYQPAFWIYFPAARPILVTKEVFAGKNDATGLSYDDVFLKRMFTSYIVKESNAKDERIKDYADGIDRLYESERIKKDLMDWELNLWQY
ncbi:MAG: gliding motility protein GldN [Mucilaginibacter sp.]